MKKKRLLGLGLAFALAVSTIPAGGVKAAQAESTQGAEEEQWEDAGTQRKAEQEKGSEKETGLALLAGRMEEDLISADGDYQYRENEDGTISITCYIGNKSDIVIPEEIDGKKVTRIEEAFDEAQHAERIEIPESVREIIDGTFHGYGCGGLEEIVVAEGNKNYSSQDGILYDNGKKELLCCPMDKRGEVMIPESVEKIGDHAFERCALKEIEIPENVLEIGERAFEDSDRLAHVKIQGKVRVLGNDAFNACFSLKSIELPESMIEIGEGAFYDCYGLEEIELPENVEKIGDLAFYGCSSLLHIEIPKGVTEIGNRTFGECSNLESIGLSRNISEIGYQAFWACSSLTSVEIPESLKEIGKLAFESCSSLTSIEIPGGVTEIGERAFYRCTSLANVKLAEGVTSIGTLAFRHCTSLEEIEIPASVTFMGKNALPSHKNVIAVVSKESQAETYAVENTIRYRYVGESFIHGPGRVETPDDGREGISSVDFAGDCAVGGRQVFFNGIDSIRVRVTYGDGSSEDLRDGDTTRYGEDVWIDLSYGKIEGELKYQDVEAEAQIGKKEYSLGEADVWDLKGEVLELTEGGTGLEVSQKEGETRYFIATCRDGGKYALRYENDDKDARLEASLYGGQDGYYDEGYEVKPFNGFTGSSEYSAYHEANVPMELEAGAYAVIALDLQNVMGEGAYRLYFGKEPKVTGIQVRNDSYVVQAGGYNWWGLDGFAFEVEYSDGSVQHLHGPRGHFAFSHPELTDPYMPYDDYGNYFVFQLKDESQAERFYDSAAGDYPVTITVSDGQVFEDVLKIQGTTPGGSEAGSTEKGYTYEKKEDGTVTITGYSGSETELEIPGEIAGKRVTGIGAYAFEWGGITSVAIPNGVTSIGEGAFYSCASLVSAKIPGSVDRIGNSAFEECSSLTEVEMPEGVSHIGNRAFYWCISLERISIPESVESIGEEAFYCCGGLTDVEIGGNVTSIGDWAFESCRNLENVSIPGSVETIGDGVFGECVSLAGVEIGEGMTSIGSHMFSGCASLENVSLPDSLENMGEGAFIGCVSLAGVSIPGNVESIGERAFEGCSNLEHVSIPERVKSIGYRAFYKCTSLAGVKLAEGVTSIGTLAFRRCTSLEEIEIPASVTFIGENALPSHKRVIAVVSKESQAEAYAIENKIRYRYVGESFVHGPGRVETPDDGREEEMYAYRENEDGTITITGYGGSGTELAIPGEIDGKKVTKIGDYAFSECGSLVSVNMPDGLSEIGSFAFSGCGSLASIKIPGSVSVIGQTAFARCTSLKNLEIPGSVSDIGYTVFAGCSGLESIVFGEGVERIGDQAFANCSSLNNVTMPESLTEIIGNSFCECSSLESVKIPGGVTYIGPEAFGNCVRLENVEIPESVTDIGMLAFDGTKWLDNRRKEEPMVVVNHILIDGRICTGEIKIPENVERIGNGAFYRCSGLENVEIPESVTSIGFRAFQGCSNLKGVRLPNNIKEIEQASFADCTSFTSIKIPGSVTTIGSDAFVGCSNLVSVEIPESVTDIEGAFSECDKVTFSVVPDSYAETYAKENGIPYKYIDSTAQESHAHQYQSQMIKATPEKNGKITEVCSICGDKKETVIYAPKSMILSASSFTYNGKDQKPSVTIRDSQGSVLKEGTDYTLKYPESSKNVGNYIVTAVFSGKYSGTMQASYTIKAAPSNGKGNAAAKAKAPKGTNFTKVTAKKKGFTLKWKKQSQATGYEIQYSTSKKFAKKATKTIIVKKNKTVSKTISKLKAKKKYYVRICAYKTVKENGKSKKLCSKWSKAKTVKTKK